MAESTTTSSDPLLQKKYDDLVEKFKVAFAKLKDSVSENQRLREQIESLSKKTGEEGSETSSEEVIKLRLLITELQDQLSVSQRATENARQSQAQASALQVQATAQAQSAKEQYERERMEHQQAEYSLQRSDAALEVAETKRKEAERALIASEKALATKSEVTASEIEKLKVRIADLSSTCDSQSAKIIELTPASEKLRSKLKESEEGATTLLEKIRLAMNETTEANTRTALAEKKILSLQNELQLSNAKVVSSAQDLSKERLDRAQDIKELESKMSTLRDSLVEQKAASGASIQLQERAKALALASAQRLRSLQAELAAKDSPPKAAVVLSVIELPQRLVSLVMNAACDNTNTTQQINKGGSGGESTMSVSCKWALVVRLDTPREKKASNTEDEDEALNTASSTSSSSSSSTPQLISRLEWIPYDSLLPTGYVEVLQSPLSSAINSRILKATDSIVKDLVSTVTLTSNSSNTQVLLSSSESLQLASILGGGGGGGGEVSEGFKNSSNSSLSLTSSASFIVTKLFQKMIRDIDVISSTASDEHTKQTKAHKEEVASLVSETVSIREEFAKYKLRAAATMRALEEKVSVKGTTTDTTTTIATQKTQQVLQGQSQAQSISTPTSPTSGDGGSGGTRIVELSEALEAETIAKTAAERRCIVLTERLNLMQGRLLENEASLETLRGELQSAAARYADDLETGGLVEEKTRLLEEAEKRILDSEMARSKLAIMIPILEAEIKTLKMRISDTEASLLTANARFEQQQEQQRLSVSASALSLSMPLIPSEIQIQPVSSISSSPFIVPHLGNNDTDIIQSSNSTNMLLQHQQQPQLYEQSQSKLPNSSSTAPQSFAQSSKDIRNERQEQQLSSDALLELLISGNGNGVGGSSSLSLVNSSSRTGGTIPILQRPTSNTSSRRSIVNGGNTNVNVKNTHSSSSSSSSSTGVGNQEDANGSPVHSRAGTRANSLMGSPGSAVLLPHSSLPARPLATVHSSGRLSRDEDDFEEDELGAAGTEDVLALQYAEVLRELKEARDLLTLQSKQLEVLKETVRESERANERLAVLSPSSPSPNADIITNKTVSIGRENSISSPSSVAAVSTNLTYLKNSVVAYMIADGNTERKRMLPAIAMLLKLSPGEVEKISNSLDGAVVASGGGSVSGGGSSGRGLGSNNTQSRFLGFF